MKTRYFILGLLFLLWPNPVARTAAETASLALINGRVWLGGDAAAMAEAVAVRGNRILRVGTTAEIKGVSDAQTQVIDLGGRLIAPGFNDAHIHFLGGALGLNQIEVSDAKTAEEVIARIAAFGRAHTDAAWLTGRGWQYTSFPGGLPTRALLDEVVRDRPVFLSAYDGHSGWANSKALELANITRDTKFDGFGEIVRDAAGEPTGVLKEGAQGLVRRLIPQPTREQKLDAVRAGMKLAASLGITSIQNASGSPDELTLYQELLKRNELTLRVGVAFSTNARTTPEELSRWAAVRDGVSPNAMLRAGAIKFVLDGVIEAHTAAMIDPYSDLATSRGELSMPVETYRALVAQADKLGFQIYTHAIGDRAVREALNAYEQAAKENGRRNRRHRIEHIETIAPDDIPRFAKLGVIASMEPIHADPATVEVWSKAVGPARLPYAFPWASFLKRRTWLVYSSDWPAAISLNPIHGLHNAVNRRTLDGQPPKGWIPQQRIAVIDALRAYTLAGAYASFEEGIKGRIEAGMLADLVVFSDDLFKIDPMKIGRSKVTLTVFDGKVIYRDGI